MGKVFHSDDDVHARVKEFCVGHDVSPKMWVGRLVTWAVDQGIVDPTHDDNSLPPHPPPTPPPYPAPQYDAVPVVKKTVPPITSDRYCVDQAPWEDKPFWDKDSAS